MTTSPWQQSIAITEAMVRPYDIDVAVVGGGVMGCSVAYWLHRLDPGLRIGIVEAQALASGASGRNAGFLLQGTTSTLVEDLERYGKAHAHALWRFTQENRALLISELDGASFDWQPCGSLTVAGSVEEEERLRRSVAPMAEIGLEATYLSPEETNHRIRSRGFFGALYVPSNGALHPVRLVHALARLSQATVLQGEAVQTIEAGSRGLRLRTVRRQVEAAQAVVTVNAFLPRLFPSLAAYVRPVRAQMRATSPIRPIRFSCPVYSHDGYYYIRQDPAGRVLLGGARHLHVEDEVGYVDATTEAVQADLKAYLWTHFPDLGDEPVDVRWSGVMGFSPDHVPVIGALDELPVKWVAGFSGHGMSYAFRMGRLMAQWVLEGSEPEGFNLFSTNRFAPGIWATDAE